MDGEVDARGDEAQPVGVGVDRPRDLGVSRGDRDDGALLPVIGPCWTGGGTSDHNLAIANGDGSSALAVTGDNNTAIASSPGCTAEATGGGATDRC